MEIKMQCSDALYYLGSSVNWSSCVHIVKGLKNESTWKCFHAIRFIAKSKKQCNLSSQTVSYLLTKVNAFLGVEEMVWDKFPTNCQSKELSVTELTAAKTHDTTWTQARFVFSNRCLKQQWLSRLLWNTDKIRGMATKSGINMWQH